MGRPYDSGQLGSVWWIDVGVRVPDADLLSALGWYKPEADFGVDSAELRDGYEVHLPVLRAVHGEHVYLPVVRHPVGPTSVRTARPKPDDTTVALQCPSCAPRDALLGAAGINDGLICYRCPNRKYGCRTDTIITDRVMLREMARKLPQILERTADVTSAMCAKPSHGGDVEARLAAICDRERIIRDSWLSRMQEPPDWLLAEVLGGMHRLAVEAQVWDSAIDQVHVKNVVLSIFRDREGVRSGR